MISYRELAALDPRVCSRGTRHIEKHEVERKAGTEQIGREKPTDNETAMTRGECVHRFSGTTAWEARDRRSGCNIARPLTPKGWSSLGVAVAGDFQRV